MEIACKEFNKQRQVTDIFKIYVNKVVVSEKVQWNNRKDHRYFLGYQVDEETITPLLIKTPKNISSYCIS